MMNHGTAYQILKVLMSVASVLLCLSPLPSIYKVYQSKTTGAMRILPLALLLLTRHMWMIYGYITDNIFPLFASYLFGEVLAIGYLVVYFKYSTQRRLVLQICFWHVLVMLLATVYALLGDYGQLPQSPGQVESVFGYLTVAGNICMFASPFETIRLVLRTKSAATVPIALCLMGCVCNVIWLVYSIADDDMFMLTSCSICLLIAAIQVALYAVFPPIGDGLETLPIDQSDRKESTSQSPVFLPVLSPQ